MKLPLTPHLWLVWVHTDDKPNPIVTTATEAVISNLTILEAIAALAVLRLSYLGPMVLPITEITAEAETKVQTRVMSELARKGYVRRHEPPELTPCSLWIITDLGIATFLKISARLSKLIERARPLQTAEQQARESKTPHPKKS